MFKERTGAEHPNWKGGRLRMDGGYVRVIAKGHPDSNRAGYILEHRLVMEKMIGRPLFPSETVHHINGQRHDNRPENLELWDHQHGGGQRHVQKIAFYSSEIMAKASDEELDVIIRSLQKRVRQRATRPVVSEQPRLL